MDIETFLFPKQTVTNCWHYMMERFHESETYQSPEIDKIIKIIQNKLRMQNSFESKCLGFTPLHVAVMTSNRAGLQFLFNQNVCPFVHDGEGNIPLNYCVNNTDIKDLLISYSTKYKIKEYSINQLFSKWKICLSSAPFTYQANTHDFGVKINKLLFKRPTEENFRQERVIIVKHFAENMKEIARIEGFELQLTSIHCIPRDIFIRHVNGTHRLPSESKNIQAAIERYDSLAFISPLSGISCSDHLYHTFNGQGAMRQFCDTSLFNDVNFPTKKNAHLSFYLEGGNYFILTNSENKMKILMGIDQLYIALNQLRLDKYFDNHQEHLTLIKQKIKQTMTIGEILNTLEEIYPQGLLELPGNDFTGMISRSAIAEVKEMVLINKMSTLLANDGVEEMIPTDMNLYFETACKQGKYTILELKDSDFGKYFNLAVDYLAQKEMTIELIAESLGGTQDSIHFIPNLLLHLDQYLHPGPKGTVFLQNYQFCVDMLNHIKHNSKCYNLSGKDLEILESYIFSSSRLETQTQPLLHKITQELQFAGIRVIPTPGIFSDLSPHLISPNDINAANTVNVNFLNSITGSSPKSEYFWIATGASVGDYLGRALMDCFKKFLNSYQKMAVHFIGYEPENRSDFNEGMRPWNHLANGVGPHCMSVELETVSHTHT